MSETPAYRLGEFELIVLLSMAGLVRGAYGAAILRDIQEHTNRQISIGGLYATLARLEEKGLVVHTVSQPLPQRGGRSRKYYELTPLGRKILQTETNILTRMMRSASLLEGTA